MTTRHTEHSIGLRVLLLAIMVPLVSQIALAEALSEKTVRKAVQTWVRQVTADARPDAVIERMEPCVVDGSMVAYIAHLNGGGYCICGADTRLLPVYLYRPIGTYDPTNPGYASILGNIARRLATLNGGVQGVAGAPEPDESILTQRAEDWQLLAVGQVPASTVLQTAGEAPTLMTLPVTTYWHQGSPFNDLCPVLTPGSDEHCVVGCVATAAAQIMYYWQWPAGGTGTVSTAYHYHYTDDWIETPLSFDPNIPAGWEGGSRLDWVDGQLRMNGYWDQDLHDDGKLLYIHPSYSWAFEALWDQMTTGITPLWVTLDSYSYDWALMADTHTDPPDAGGAEAAKLSYHAGVAVQMAYGVKSSSSFQSNMASVLSSNFGYSNNASNRSRQTSAIVNEIQWLRPVQLGGQGDNGGHSWVVAGYNTNPEQYLMNMGWGGGTTQWYTIDAVFPDDQDMLIWISPRSVVRYVGGIAGGNGNPAYPYEDLAAAVADAPDGTTLVFKAGTTNVAPGEISKPLTLKGRDVTLTTVP